MTGREWVNKTTGNVRVYLTQGSKDIRKANTFFCTEKENAKYIWKCNGGYFHADKCYNGWLIKELREMFPSFEIGELEQ